MSPRRKSGLSPKHLEALEHLGDVLEALEALQEQHAKVRALIGPGVPVSGDGKSTKCECHDGFWCSACRVVAAQKDAARAWVAEWEQRKAWQERFPAKSSASAAAPVDPTDPEANHRIMERLRAEEGFPTVPHNAPPLSAILDTPERREYEEAKRAGKVVPPDLLNISDAQRERMAEQRALIQAERRRKGLPPSSAPAEVGTDEQVVRTEELPTSASGSAGSEEDPEVH